MINCLRMRPDRIIVGEVRGAEALDMLQAMNTGHDGSLTTVHANSPRDALSRIETMVAMTGLDIPQRAVRQQIASAIDVVVQVARLSDGTPPPGEPAGDHRHGRRRRHHAGDLHVRAPRRGRATATCWASCYRPGVRPHFTERLRLAGIPLPADAVRAPRIGGEPDAADGLRARYSSP